MAIATGLYDDPHFRPLPVDAEVRALTDWLCAPSLGVRAFAPAYPELAHNPSERAVTDALKNPEPYARWRAKDAAVVFVTGHGETSDGVHWTILKASESLRLPATALRTADLIMWLKATEIRHLFLVLDLCFAGKTITEVAAFEKDIPATWLVLPSATRDQEAVTGALTGAVTAFLAELDSREGESYAGEKIKYLDVQAFLEGIRAHLRPGQRLEPLQGSQTSGPHPCLPNPHYRAQDATTVQAPRSDLAIPQADVEAHWGPKSRGSTADGGSGWLFTGRRQLMLDLIAAATGEPGAMVVTGSAGSGKSAVLARLVTLSDPAFRMRYAARLGDIPPDLRPAEGAVDVAVLATGKNPSDVIAQIAIALNVPPPPTKGAQPALEEWVAAWQNWLTTGTSKITVVVDALDETPHAMAILTGELARLDPGRTRLRLIVGVRSPGGDDNTPPDARTQRGVPLADYAEYTLVARRIRVDEAPWWAPADLADYAAAILTTTPGSPYQHPDVAETDDTASAVAQALAARAGTSFLVTRIAAANLARRPEPVSPTDGSWLKAVDEGVRGVLRQDLDTYCHNDPEQRLQTVHLLRALAFARGRGIPWRRIWPAFANAVADDPDRTYGDSDIADLLHSPFGGYLTTDIADGTTVYRLFHDALNTTLRDQWRDLLEPATPAP
ncbi:MULTISPECIES: ATP-binding protein [unclassified Streptomyces]|uniref:ATP-binding protein n=1 Tax=unclassified Streptomyces TaxID=2593676 RepID=UPI00114C9D1C|nr:MULTISPECIES: ATP-binding protein [unclassified Streptomyces]MYS24832.1 hypothetical protein [Streptomyces sp. SID4948]